MILPFQTVNHACDKLRVCRTVSTFPVVSKHHALLSDISLFPARMNGMPDCMLYSAGTGPAFLCDGRIQSFRYAFQLFPVLKTDSRSCLQIDNARQIRLKPERFQPIAGPVFYGFCFPFLFHKGKRP